MLIWTYINVIFPHIQKPFSAPNVIISHTFKSSQKSKSALLSILPHVPYIHTFKSSLYKVTGAGHSVCGMGGWGGGQSSVVRGVREGRGGKVGREFSFLTA